jgi:hypothetical protein
LHVWLTAQNRLETRSVIAGCSHDHYLDPGERKQPLASTRWLHSCLHGVNDCMDRLQRVTRARSDQALRSVINRARDL